MLKVSAYHNSTIKSPEDISKISRATGVKAVRPLQTFSRPEMISPYHSTTNAAIGTPVEQSSNLITGVTKLHAEGITGLNITIGIIDTGIDYTNAALGSGFGPGFKVVGGYDYVGDNYTGPGSIPVPDPDPLDQCNGHGTHVAGIIAADPSANPYNISGVAYSASISMYRIFGCQGYTEDDLIVQAMLQAVQDGNDILSLSLGGSESWTESTTAVVASRIADSGIVVSVSAGNSGESGAWYISGPSTGLDVISVASVNSPTFPVQSVIVSGVEHDPIVYYDFLPLLANESLPIYATSNDTSIPNDACQPLPDDTPDLSQYIVIVRRGNCTFLEKLANIEAKGGKQTLIYDNGKGFAPIIVGNYSAALILPKDGEFLVRQFAAGVPVNLTFPPGGNLVQYHDPDGVLVSDFSSYGSTFDLFLKPSLSAPGGNILSSIPTTNGSYGLESGTSMAAPFVAGSAALLLQAMGKSADVAKGIRTRLQTTAKYVSSNRSDTAPLQTVTSQGAGLIDVFAAATASTYISPGEFLLNDTTHFNRDHCLTIQNKGSMEKRYNIRHVPAGTAITITPGSITAAPGPVPLTKDYASVSFSTTSFTLEPGQARAVNISFTPPDGLDPVTLPIYSGFIQVDSENESLHVSYMGVAGSLVEKQILDTNATLSGFPLPAVVNASGDPQEGPRNYTFNETAGDYPTIIARRAFGSPLLRVDLVDHDINLTTNLNPPLTPVTPLVDTLGLLKSYGYIQRNNESEFGLIELDSITFDNGTTIPAGSYRVYMRVLRVTGDPDNESDYESWLSPIIGFFPEGDQ
ncbi:hypothetical protein Moror_10326 [Moniliophthora roreri MCA 2997]|uniref:Subtilisin-like protease n=1 Tax=Moniliophthora roreri (strain MCA 2997) TaxID=1381753 RepID=V2XE90_MONRO|nr:hypothetical protein Moror_10326 [Moniliophthora roreri MCA 2997]